MSIIFFFWHNGYRINPMNSESHSTELVTGCIPSGRLLGGPPIPAAPSANLWKSEWLPFPPAAADCLRSTQISSLTKQANKNRLMLDSGWGSS